MALCPLVSLLDPRPREEAIADPISEAVNIPLLELAGRMHELPSRRASIQVAGPEPQASQAIDYLRQNGREAVLATAWSYGEASPGRLWEPNPFLIEVASQLPAGRALDLACGTGRDAVALAGLGWKITAVDHLEDALERGRDLARRYLSAEEAGSIAWTQLNLEPVSTLPEERFDLVSMVWYLNRQLLRLTPQVLAPGGSLVVETFTSVHRERFGKPRTEAFVLKPGELPELTSSLQVRHYEEGWHGDRHSARLWASK